MNRFFPVLITITAFSMTAFLIAGCPPTNNEDQNPDLTVTKTANPLSYESVGDVITYTITVKNTGNVTLTNTVVADPLTGLNEIILSLAPDATEVYIETYTIIQADLDAGSVSNTASAVGEDPNGQPVGSDDSAIVDADGYDYGYEQGFFTDSKYWEGYADSYDTEPPDGPILYSGSEIPQLDDDSYDAGYYDGLWYAYSDGYYVSYDYGFTIGFSEGYDIGFSEFWYDFLIDDVHPEFLDGSFMDGYQDGFSEGSIFGASDYEAGFDFDWEDAMWDYRAGKDLYIEAVGFGTGEYGDVYLYEWGVDPNTYYEKADAAARRVRYRTTRQLRKAAAGRDVVSPRVSVDKGAQPLKQSETKEDGISYRPLTDAVRAQLDVRPQYSPRFNGRSLLLPDTWLERIERYRAERQ